MTFLSLRYNENKAYILSVGSEKIPVYCHMTNEECGDGGWTLVMKIDGSKVIPLLNWPVGRSDVTGWSLYIVS